MSKTTSNAVAATKNTLPVMATAFEEDAGSGFENATADSYAIPFLGILQSGSPQVKKSDGAYIKGAEEGMFINTVTQDLFDGEKGVTVIPVYFKRSFVKWAPRAQGGGYRGELLPSDPQVLANKTNSEGVMIDSEGNELADTRTHYVLLLGEDGSYQQIVVSMSSTQIKKSRHWMTRMNGLQMKRGDGSTFTPPMFSHMYHLSTVPESNDKGSWFGWKVETLGPVTDAHLYAAAKAFRDAISSGEVREQTPAPQGVSEHEEY